MKKHPTYLLFCMTFNLYIIYRICCFSYYSQYISEETEDIIKLTILFLVILELFFEQKFSINRLALIIFLAAGSLLVYIKTSISEALVLIFLVIGANHLNLRAVVKQSIPLIIALTVFIILSSLTGIIPNDAFLRNGEKQRVVKAFGFYGYATIPYVFLMLNFLYTYVKSTIRFKDLLFWLIAGIFIYYTFTNRLTLVLQIFFYVMYGILQRKRRYTKKIFRMFALTIPWIFAGISFGLSYFFNLANPIMYFINNALSWRLYYGKLGIERYSVGLFGQYIEMAGNMAIGKEAELKYFYIDCGYLHTLLTFGILFSILLLILYSAIGHYAVASGDLVLFCMITTILLGNCINNLWLRLDVNPVLLLSFSALEAKRPNKPK